VIAPEGEAVTTIMSRRSLNKPSCQSTLSIQTEESNDLSIKMASGRATEITPASDPIIKVALAGDSVGKTSLIKTIRNEDFKDDNPEPA